MTTWGCSFLVLKSDLDLYGLHGQVQKQINIRELREAQSEITL